MAVSNPLNTSYQKDPKNESVEYFESSIQPVAGLRKRPHRGDGRGCRLARRPQWGDGRGCRLARRPQCLSKTDLLSLTVVPFPQSLTQRHHELAQTRAQRDIGGGAFLERLDTLQYIQFSFTAFVSKPLGRWARLAFRGVVEFLLNLFRNGRYGEGMVG